MNKAGRNVWVASAPDWKGRKVTSFNDDDGQEIAELSWAPQADYLLFTRGGDFEMGRDNPNPSYQTREAGPGDLDRLHRWPASQEAHRRKLTRDLAEGQHGGIRSGRASLYDDAHR